MGGMVGCVVVGKSCSKDGLYSVASTMSRSLSYQGKDKGIWAEEEYKLVFANNRMAVQEPSGAGKQPMFSSNGRYVISLCGEVYNHLEIREKLAREYGTTFKGRSDTETVVEAIAAKGLVNTLSMLNGMFAFSLWDGKNKKLFLARDRFGQKPLYYGWNNNNFIFASELRALKSHPDFIGNIHKNALLLYFKHGFIPSPFSIYNGIFKLSPGSYLVLDGNNMGSHANFWPVADTVNALSPTRFWKEEDVIRDGLNESFAGSEKEAMNALEQKISDAVSKCMIADINVGATLTGDDNSSLIAAIAGQITKTKLNTYSIAISEEQYGITKHAAHIAKHIDSNHHEFVLKRSETLNAIPNIGNSFDEPFADISQIPYFMLSHKASETSSICLTGEGGNQILGGKADHYRYCNHIHDLFSKTPGLVRKSAAFVTKAIGVHKWDLVLHKFPMLCPDYLLLEKNGANIQKLACAFEAGDMNNFYKEMLSLSSSPHKIVPEATEPHYLFDNKHEKNSLSFLEYMMMTDAAFEVPDKLMTTIDRTGSSAGIELRCPFTDNNLFKFAWTLPMEMKVSNKQTPNIMQQLVHKYIPAEICDSPSQNSYNVFIRQVINRDLKAWADDMLSKESLEKSGLLNVSGIRQMWLEHTSGNCDWYKEIWAILMFQSWLE